MTHGKTHSQAKRPLTIETPLGPDALLVSRLDAEEGLSELFRYRLQLLAPRSGLPASAVDAVPVHDLLGQPVTIHLKAASAERHLHGIVREVVRIEKHHDKDHLHFEAEVVPTLWLWTQRVRSRIFQQQSVPDVLKAVLAELRPDVEFQLSSSYPTRNYVVQYRESDFAFVSRLMEDEGISYFFRQEAVPRDKESAEPEGSPIYRHVLVVTDQAAGFPALSTPAHLRYDDSPHAAPDVPRIHAWKTTQQVRRQVFTLRDQHFQLPGTEPQRPLRTLEAASAVSGTVQTGRLAVPLTVKPLRPDAAPLEWYEHSTGFARGFDNACGNLGAVYDDHRRLARVRQEEETAAAISVEGIADYLHLAAGCKFNVSHLGARSGPYLFTRITQTAMQIEPHDREDPRFQHECRFTCVPEGLPVRPARKTPRPNVAGTQTAVVAGAPGQPVDVDELGRIKVQFYWDRSDRYNQDSSCRVRVAQSWAGNRYGAFFWPRPGHEVVVTFEDGDPDRPLIVGSVYNAANLPPLTLPGGADSAGFKSCTMGGNPMTEANALVFHDEAGDERVQLHSINSFMNSTNSFQTTNVPGANVEVFGSFPIGSVGSGSGGGLNELITGISYAWGSDNAWATTFPGNTSLYFGNNVGATIMGSRYTHVFPVVGCESKIVGDVASILSHFKPSVSGAAGGLAVAARVAGGVGHLLTHGLLGQTGTCDMVFGDKSTLIYSGDKIDVVRGVKREYVTGDWFAKDDRGEATFKPPASTVNKIMVASAAFLDLLALAGDLAAALTGDFWKDQAYKIKPSIWSNLIGVGVASRVQGIIYALEVRWILVMEKVNKVKTEAAKVTDAAKLTAEIIKHAPTGIVGGKTLKLNVEELLADVTNLQTQGITSVNPYTIVAPKLDLVATAPLNPDQKPPITIRAVDGPVSVSGGTEAYVGVFGSGGFAMSKETKEVLLGNGMMDGTLEVYQNGIFPAQILMRDKEMTLAVNPTAIAAASAVKLTHQSATITSGLVTEGKFAPDSIVLKVGLFSLKIDTSGIHLAAGPSTIDVTPQGVTIKGLSIELKPTMLLDLNATMIAFKSNATIVLKSSVPMLHN